MHSVKNAELSAWAKKPFDNEADRLDAYRDPRYKSGNEAYIKSVEGKEIAGLAIPTAPNEDEYVPLPITDEEAAKIAKAEAEWEINPFTGGATKKDDDDGNEPPPQSSGAFCSIRVPS